MIEVINELNRVLLVVSELVSDGNPAPVESVIEQCASTVIEGRMPNHELSVDYANSIGFIKRVASHLELTEEGMAFLELNPERFYELTDGQKGLVIRKCFLHGPFRERARKVFKCFTPTFEGRTFRWSEVDSTPIEEEDWVIEHLFQLGLVSRVDGAIEVATDYVETVTTFLDEGKGWTEEQFQKHLQEKMEVGETAEKLVLNYEKERLKAKGFVTEAHCIRRVNRLLANAGYDIESFNGKSKDLNYDRFIEVKGSRGKGIRFFWSQNEISVARKLGDKYWIYYQENINVKSGSSVSAPVTIRNPIETILNNDKVKKTPQGILVEGKIV